MNRLVEAKILPTFESWRGTSRSLLQQQIEPAQILWNDGSMPMLPIADQTAHEPFFDSRNSTSPGIPPVPREFITQAQTVSYHRDPVRWPLLYRILFRLTHNEKNLLQITTDDDVHQFYEMEKNVRRDLHKMHAFVRFRRVSENGQDRYIAFHRPDHLIMPAAAPWFAKRFANMHWTILTPDASATWDTEDLTLGPGAARSPVSEDDLEDLWRTYYASIFNPARVKVKAMKKEMAVRHWPTLPETELIPRLLRSARTRVHSMVESSAPAPGIGVSALEFMPRTTELPVLREAIHQCHGCELYCHATQPVFGRGPENAALMFVGEQPGDQEDLAGLPFVGPAGQLFDEALATVGIDRSACYVTNSVKHFRFEVRGKRRIHSKPSARHVAACKPWLQAEINIVKPRMVVVLGSTAAAAILGPTIRILRDRGQVFRDNPIAPWIMPTIHPSALLRMPDPDQRALAHEQFLADLRTAAGELFRRSP